MSVFSKSEDLLANFAGKSDQILRRDAKVLPRTLRVLTSNNATDLVASEVEVKSINLLINDILDDSNAGCDRTSRRHMNTSEYVGAFDAVTVRAINRTAKAADAFCSICDDRPEIITALQELNNQVTQTSNSRAAKEIGKVDVSECERVERYVQELSLIYREISSATSGLSAKSAMSNEIESFICSTNEKTESIAILKEATPIV
jgi:hypothetical protein